MRGHLSDDEIYRLCFPGTDVGIDGGEEALPPLDEDAHDHWVSCKSCRWRGEQHTHAQAKLGMLRLSGYGNRQPDCPAEERLLALAAECVTGSEAEALLHHAALCDYCGPQLAEAARQFSQSTSPEEEKMLAQLKSANPGWQRQMALRMAAAGTAARATDSEQAASWWVGLFRSPRLAWASALAVLIVGAAGWAVLQYRANDVDTMLAKAYTERRTIEMRIPEAAYAPLRVERGSGGLEIEKRPRLFNALSSINQGLAAHPDSAKWLQAKGRAETLAGRSDDAISILEHARQIAPTDISVLTDLASAYFLRGIGPPEHTSDLATADDLLGQVLIRDPNNSVALFNRGIANERLGTLKQAAADWQRFLQISPRSDWAPEAKQRLTEVQRRIQEHEQRSNAPLLTPQQIAALTANGGHQRVFEELERRSERYLKVAAEVWLPDAFAPRPRDATSSAAARHALTLLAAVAQTKHQDPWLSDLLQETTSPVGGRAAFALARAIALNQTDDRDQARQQAQQAAHLFRSLGAPAGEMRARFELIFADQLAHDNARCWQESSQLATDQRLHRYRWVMIQNLIESTVCAPAGMQAAAIEQARTLSAASNYDELSLRSVTLLSDMFWNTGDMPSAWRAGARAMQLFWDGDFPSQRGYNALTQLEYIAWTSRQWNLQTSILEEAMPFISSDQDHVMRGFSQGRMGQAQIRAGNTVGGEENLREGNALMAEGVAGDRKTRLQAEAEVDRSGVDLDIGDATTAMARLGRVGSTISQIPNDRLQLIYETSLGEAAMAGGNRDQAERAYAAAFRIAELSLPHARGEAARLDWARDNAPLYAGIVQLKAEEDPAEALAYWEWYLGAPLRTAVIANQSASATKLSHLGLDSGVIQPGREVLVTYVEFAERTAAFVYDGRTVQLRWLPMQRTRLEALARRFSELCADPDSSLELLQRRGHELYTLLILPVEHLLKPGVRLLIEPDGALGLVPFSALTDDQEHYLAERLAITISPGVAYLAQVSRWEPVSGRSRALIVGDPSAPGFVPLPDAEREARTVLRDFPNSVLLLHEQADAATILRDIPEADIFQFSGHAVASSDIAGPVLAGAAVLDSVKLDNLSLHRTKLVVLSACASAGGTGGLFTDRDSLVRKLIAASVPEVVASRWMVDSATTAKLVEGFYQQLLSGQDVPHALRQAAMEMRTHPATAHPYYWAGLDGFGRG